MIKSIFIATAALLSAPAAIAFPIDRIDPGFGVAPGFQINRDAPFAIRSCGDAYGPKTDVCYNQRTNVYIPFPGGRIAYEGNRVRSIRVRCDLNIDRTADTTRNIIAGTYCDSAFDGSLPPAPFLL